jgi:hypothetical protein
MKILVIGHPDAVLGFSLAGVGGRAASTVEEVNQALDEAQASKEWRHCPSGDWYQVINIDPIWSRPACWSITGASFLTPYYAKEIGMSIYEN